MSASVPETELERKRALVKELLSKKEKLEAEIKKSLDTLKSQNVGMTTPLVDREGFPRGDVDLHVVRSERHDVIMMQNDHKALMIEVEKAIHDLHAAARALSKPSETEPTSDQPPQAFAKINSVMDLSPAQQANLRAGDLVICFGSVNAANYNGLHSVSNVVSSSEGRPLEVKVWRGDSLKTDEWRVIIEKLGGIVNENASKKKTHYVTTEEEALNPTARYKKAIKDGTIVVTESFLEDSVAKDKLEDPADHHPSKPMKKRVTPSSPSSQPTTRSKRIKKEPAPAPAPAPAVKPSPKTSPKATSKAASKAASTPSSPPSSPPSTMVTKVFVKKGRAVVDEYCPVKNDYHVYDAGDDGLFTFMLNQTDVTFNVKGHNKYFLMQVLEPDNAVLGKYALWSRWGRVGNKGQNSLKLGLNQMQAHAMMTRKFFDKTGNLWDNRDKFQKIPGKYDVVETEIEDENEKKEQSEEGSEVKKEEEPIPDSTLPDRVQELMKMICNVNTYKETVLSMKFDANKMPLGKLSKAQVRKGYEALKIIEGLINKGTTSGADLAAACNTFYTSIPHDFGFSKPTMITDILTVQSKMKLLETLGEIEIAMSMMKEADKTKAINPIDARYQALHTSIQPIQPEAEEYKLVEEYMRNTHGSTHSSYTLELADLFAVQREGEEARFNSTPGNVQLLWHGSGISNYVGILSQGLRIAPPEAPVSGYMFGKGVYFADMVSKSAGYCRCFVPGYYSLSGQGNNEGLLLLCEVALGKPHELKQANYRADKLPSGTHSTKGLGRIVPDPKGANIVDGVTVPMGKSVSLDDNDIQGFSLMYNEFIVYDVAQIRIKYLLRCKFNQKKGNLQ